MHENEERNPMTSKTGSIGEFMTSTKRVVTDRAAAREASAHMIEQTQIIRLSVKSRTKVDWPKPFSARRNGTGAAPRLSASS
jgi:hypothetical protein